MIVRGKRAEIFINADQIARVVDNGEDGIEVVYAGNPRPVGINQNAYHDDGFIPDFLGQLQADARFTPLGGGRHGPSEYVNFNNVMTVVLEDQTATVYFPNEQRAYGGRDYDEIARRVKAIA